MIEMFLCLFRRAAEILLLVSDVHTLKTASSQEICYNVLDGVYKVFYRVISVYDRSTK